MSRNWLDIIKDKLNQRQFEASADDWSSMEDLLNQQMPVDGGSSASGGGSGIGGGISGMSGSTLISWVVGGLLVVSHAASNYVDPEKFAEVYRYEETPTELREEIQENQEEETNLNETLISNTTEETAAEASTLDQDVNVEDEGAEEAPTSTLSTNHSALEDESASQSSKSLATASAVAPLNTIESNYSEENESLTSTSSEEENVSALNDGNENVAEEIGNATDEPNSLEKTLSSEIAQENETSTKAEDGNLAGKAGGTTALAASSEASRLEGNSSLEELSSEAANAEDIADVNSSSSKTGEADLIDEAPSPLLPADYESSFEKLSVKSPLLTTPDVDLSVPEKVEPLVTPQQKLDFSRFKPSAIRASFGYSNLGTTYSLMPEWTRGSHLFGAGLALGNDQINYQGIQGVERQQITWIEDWQSFNYWGIGSIDSTWNITGVNQGSWQVDTNFVLLTDSQQVVTTDTSLVTVNENVERVMSVRSYSIPFRYAYRFPSGRWDHRIGAIGSIGMTEAVSINEDVEISIDRSMRYTLGLDMGTDFYFRPDMAVGLSWNPQYRSFSEAKLEDTIDWAQFRVSLRLVLD